MSTRRCPISLFNTATDVIRQRLSREVGDCILATLSAGSTTTATLATTDPPHFIGKADDYFNEKYYQVYPYEGTNIGVSTYAYGWVQSTKVLTVGTTQASAYTTSTKLELHRLFTVQNYYDAINAAINDTAGKYLLKVKDDTSITLVESTGNDDSTIYTWEYSIPTSFLYITRITTERSVSGVKLTGTISGDFTLGETVEGSSSGATGIVSYGPSTASYILVREVDGTFTTSDTVTGATSGETVTTITSVDSETVGDGTFPIGNIIDPREWDVIQIPGGDKIQLDRRHYNIVVDLRLRIEGLGSQAEVDDDTDAIYIDPTWLIERAITHLPISSLENPNKLIPRYNLALQRSAVIPTTIVPVGARRVFE